MKKLILVFIVSAISTLFTTTSIAAPDDAKDIRDKNASEVAKAWFTSLIQGNTNATISLSEVPFDLNKQQEAKSLTDLKIIYDKIVAEEASKASEVGKRWIISSTEIKSSTPDKVEVILRIKDGEGVLVIVRPGDAYKIIGYWD